MMLSLFLLILIEVALKVLHILYYHRVMILLLIILIQDVLLLKKEIHLVLSVLVKINNDIVNI